VTVTHLERGTGLGVLVPLEPEQLVGGVVGGLDGVPSLELPGDGELPGVGFGVEDGLDGGEAVGPVGVGVLDAASAGAERVGEADLVGQIDGEGAVERGARGGGGVEAGGVGVGEAEALVVDERRVHELEAHILRGFIGGVGKYYL
jgi:hypothetical protein